MIWVATPNLKSEGLRTFHSNWRGLDPPRHLVLFTPDSLKLSCIKAGFSDVSLKPCHVSVYKKSYRMSLNLKPFNNVKAGKLPLKIRIKLASEDLKAVFNTKVCEEIIITANKYPE
jgi:type II secretory pathway predicted ATPase ExeA